MRYYTFSLREENNNYHKYHSNFFNAKSFFVHYFPVVSGSSTNLRAFRVQKKCGVIVGVILFFKKFLTPSITPLQV